MFLLALAGLAHTSAAKWESAGLDWIWLAMTSHPVFVIFLLGTAGRLGTSLSYICKRRRRASQNGQVLFQASASIMFANSLLDKAHHMAELNFKRQDNTFCPLIGAAAK